MRILLSASLLLVALHAFADAPGNVPTEAERAAAARQGGPAAGQPPVTAQQGADGRRVITNTGDSAGMVNLLNRSMPSMRAREAQDYREQEALRREREAEQQAALIHHTECYRMWGEATCATKLK